MRSLRATFCVALLVLVTLHIPLVATVEGRSVHSTSTVDLLPQGTFQNPGVWDLTSETSFTQDAAAYTEVMVADQRLTMAHQRPVHLDTMTIWASTSPSDSNLSTGAPDSSSTWSTGPEIELTDFDVSGLLDYELVKIEMQAVIQITEALQQDTVRISLEHGGQYDLIKTFAHTQGNLDYINQSAFTTNLTGLEAWSWDNISSMIFTLDYVSQGGADDARLVVDAVGLAITVRTPWYGGEVGIAQTSFDGHEMPVMNLNLSEGNYDNIALADCGLQSSIQGTSGTWTSPVMYHPPEQRLSRVHYSLENDSIDDVVMSYSLSLDGENFAQFEPLVANMLLPDAVSYQLKFSATDSCLSSIWVDVNDPSISIDGRVFGSNDGIDANYSRWLFFVNDELVSNEPMVLGSFSHEWPIGAYLHPGSSSLDIMVKAWFTWDSMGNSSTTALEFNSMSVQGGYEISYDEDPMCEALGDQTLVEDAGGLILPLLLRCTDDRTAYEDLTVVINNSNDEVVTVDLAEGDVRVSLRSEASGQSTVLVTVSDEAGNTWSEQFQIIVEAVDDPPQIEEFQSLIPVERDTVTVINVSASDVDSNSLTASTNKSWAQIDLSTGQLTVAPPTAGFHSVLISVGDQTSCSTREVDLDVMALAELFIESMSFSETTLVEGDIIAMKVYVRNQGQAEATMVSVRCETDDQLIAVKTIPILRPGELDIVVCDWQIPENSRVIKFRAVVDRGLEIPEGDETNNIVEALKAIEERSIGDDVSAGSEISTRTIWVGMIGALLLIVGLFVFFTPDKIRKIE